LITRRQIETGGIQARPQAGRQGQALYSSDDHETKGQDKCNMGSKALFAAPGKHCRYQNQRHDGRQRREQNGTVHGSQGQRGADKNQGEQACGRPARGTPAPIAMPTSSPMPPVGRLCREA
jgi:hypothetical protein